MKRDTLTIINAASRDDLYHVKDNLLGYAFCVKLLSLLLYRLRAIEFLVRTFRRGMSRCLGNSSLN